MSQELWGLRCVTCDRLMIQTPSGYVSCPRGHGRLLQEAEAACEGPSLFSDEEVE